MEYMTMLEEPGMVAGLQELIEDSDPSVVKRTIRVFTNVYRHALSLLATGDLDPAKYEMCYSEINSVSNQLINMLQVAENEGIVVHLVRYLEAALVSHILSDLSSHPHIAEMTAPMLKKGVAALFQLVNAPFVGGSAFCVAIRALFTVACYQVNMRQKVTDVVEALIDSPPPNLFDHNVRSFHKILQRNFFRLLKRAKEAADKERLIDLMVRVGVPRKRLVEWAPRFPKKRSIYAPDETSQSGKISPPSNKRQKVTEEEIISLSSPVLYKNPSPPSSGRSTPSSTASKAEVGDHKQSSISTILDKILSGDKISDMNWLPAIKSSSRLLSPSSNLENTAKIIPKVASPGKFDRKLPLGEVSNQVSSDGMLIDSKPVPEAKKERAIGHGSSPRLSPKRASTGLLCSPNDAQVKVVANMESEARLSEIIKMPTKGEFSHINGQEYNFTTRCSSLEKTIYDKLNTSKVVDMLLDSLEYLPEQKPKYIPLIHLEELEVMKEKLTILLAAYSSDTPDEQKVSTLRKSSPSSLEHTDCKPASSDHKKLSSLPCEQLSLFSSKDVDLRRQLLPNTVDVDMRSVAQSRDPRVKRGLLSSENDQDLRSQTSTASKLQSRDPRLVANATSNSRNNDPTLDISQTKVSTADAAASLLPDPRLVKCGSDSFSNNKYSHLQQSSCMPALYNGPPPFAPSLFNGMPVAPALMVHQRDPRNNTIFTPAFIMAGANVPNVLQTTMTDSGVVDRLNPYGNVSVNAGNVPINVRDPRQSAKMGLLGAAPANVGPRFMHSAPTNVNSYYNNTSMYSMRNGL